MRIDLGPISPDAIRWLEERAAIRHLPLEEAAREVLLEAIESRRGRGVQIEEIRQNRETMKAWLTDDSIDSAINEGRE
jgi:hypothetical protein